ncbi:innexin inx2-like isoform X1 [Penaeus indicus]|uniref:innexin inx2-like isoform X1 n=1 Tax=Penaeus indicus TaxID=29960 RepID=UPI00300CC0DD
MISLFDELMRNQKAPQDRVITITSLSLTSMKVTMNITFIGFVFATARSYIGDVIDCVTGMNEAEHKAIETYCYITSHFTVVDLATEASAHPGVGPSSAQNTTESLQRHAYYQWVPFVLMLQMIIYYFPVYLWHRVDFGFFDAITLDLDKVFPDKAAERLKLATEYFVRSLGTHGRYALSFLLCEGLAASLALGNLAFTNKFLGGKFFRYGLSAAKFVLERAPEGDGPLDEVFPKVTKCTWHKFGASGSLQTHDALCVLPMNVMNEKTFLVLWFVQVATAAVCVAVLSSHLLLVASPALRNGLLSFLTHSETAKEPLLCVLHESDFGDWFLLFHLRSHVVDFTTWLLEVDKEMRREASPEQEEPEERERIRVPAY